VRTRFMGNIASPVMGISPMETVKELWGGKLPEFESMDAVNELFNALVAGLWNRLAEHQSSRHPFKLLRLAVAPTREELKYFALFRQQEVDGFVDGLFGPEKYPSGCGARIRRMAVLTIDGNLAQKGATPKECQSPLTPLLRLG
jgi:hypothetical protein